MQKSTVATTAGSRYPSSSNRHGDQSSPTRSPSTTFGGLEGAGWLNYIERWSAEDIALLLRACRPGTLKTYSSCWKRCLEWARENKVPVNSPTP
ncbi:unnamed protein product [Acanthoscelides obtectus]|uniref:Core-binding (CB) domain-containing protein n=1 Tax=Acanthoscelides obtectus TaxID=200917 RepID=A0A9P0PBI2_ACAOB|nr:unnamed protein product [Acanthoscelides obtectus]CAK1647628.1 hypothetical protein AOBTE_LOCUS15308 [Acanthoscelides obtectus]